MRARRPWRVGAAAVIGVAVLGIAGTVGAGVLQSAGASSTVAVAPSVAPTAAALYVHVSGAVRAPGLYVLDPDARVVDAVAAAGGFADGADSASVNLARTLADGEQLVIGAASVGPDGVAAPAPVADSRIDINTATEAELDALPRVGPAIAARIVAWRTENGRFSSADDLLLVAGIGEKMLEEIRPLVRT